ncbi:hypothetical protein AB7849_15190 [Rhodanobacter sp. 115]
MLDQSVLDLMDELGDQADEVIGMAFAAAEVEMTLRLVRMEAEQGFRAD